MRIPRMFAVSSIEVRHIFVRLPDGCRRCPYNLESDNVFGWPEMDGTESLGPDAETPPACCRMGRNHEARLLPRVPDLKGEGA